MIPTNSAWHEQTSVKIGDYGEKLVRDFLEAKDYICYKAVTSGAHLMDYLIYRKDKGVIAAECKVKAIRRKYTDTGFDFRSYERYKNFADEHKMRMFIFFIDEAKCEIYGNFLDVLDKKRVFNGKEYPCNEKTSEGKIIRYYPYGAMIKIKNLTCEEVNFFSAIRKGQI